MAKNLCVDSFDPGKHGNNFAFQIETCLLVFFLIKVEVFGENCPFF